MTNIITTSRLAALKAARFNNSDGYAVAPAALSQFSHAATAEEALELARDELHRTNETVCAENRLSNDECDSMRDYINADYDECVELLATF